MVIILQYNNFFHFASLNIASAQFFLFSFSRTPAMGLLELCPVSFMSSVQFYVSSIPFPPLFFNMIFSSDLFQFSSSVSNQNFHLILKRSVPA